MNEIIRAITEHEEYDLLEIFKALDEMIQAPVEEACIEYLLEKGYDVHNEDKVAEDNAYKFIELEYNRGQ